FGTEFRADRPNALVGGIERQEHARQVILCLDARQIEVRQDMPDAVEPLHGGLAGRSRSNGMVFDAAECAEHVDASPLNADISAGPSMTGTAGLAMRAAIGNQRESTIRESTGFGI